MRLPPTASGPALALALAVALAVSASTWSPPAGATVVVVPELEELTHRSEVVIQAVVREVVTFKDEQGRLITETALEVVDGIRGAKLGDVVPVQQLGGSLDGQEAWIAGNHRFTIGEEVVFFGVRLKSDRRVVIPYGVGFGIFAVRDDVDGRHVVEIGSGDVSQLIRTPDGGSRMAPVVPRHFDNLDDFKAQLRTILAGRNAPALPRKRMLRPQLRAPAPTAATTAKE
jgi:hypothetical protein